MEEIEKVNKDYYERLYGSYHPLLFRLHGAISFDQKSKTKLNMRMLGPVIRRKRIERIPLRVLDYGCGFGTFLLGLPRTGIEAFAYDISDRVVEQLGKAARYTGRTIQAAIVDENGRIDPSEFDVILCSHVLEHVPSDEELITELVRVLRPGGYILVNVPLNERWSDPRHVRGYDEEKLFSLLQAAGLKVVEVMKADRLTDFLLKRQIGAQPGVFERLTLRSMRGALSVIAEQALQISDRVLPKSYLPQQLLMLAAK